ncbi:hypothetical protein SAMN06297422_1049 [Lachnospiraceae bacterium]|nr:hypothetical protein SAMN06297422_1049 [Lachnospiraceae bacterium]
MFRVVNDYISKLHIGTDSEVYDKMSDFLTKDKKVESFNININYNRYIVDIKMKKYSVDSADILYRRFESAVSYPYSHISVRYNEDNRVRYRFVTCQENKTGVYMDVIISGK